MSDIRNRLEQCFRLTFPKLSEEDIARASIESVDDWDSLATLNLTALIQEEFGFQISPAELDQMVSFESIYLSVKSKQSTVGQD